ERSWRRLWTTLVQGERAPGRITRRRLRLRRAADNDQLLPRRRERGDCCSCITSGLPPGMEMVHRSVPGPDAKSGAGDQRFLQVAPGSHDRVLWAQPLGDAGRNSCSERAAGSMVVLGRDPRERKPRLAAASVDDEIDA